jgi:hypothetical protein
MMMRVMNPSSDGAVCVGVRLIACLPAKILARGSKTIAFPSPLAASLALVAAIFLELKETRDSRPPHAEDRRLRISQTPATAEDRPATNEITLIFIQFDARERVLSKLIDQSLNSRMLNPQRADTDLRTRCDSQVNRVSDTRFIMLAVRQALTGFDSSTELRYRGHLDDIAFAWFSRLMAVVAALAVAIVITRGEFVLDSYSSVKAGCHIVCMAIACLGYLIGKHIGRPWKTPGCFASTVACLTILAERLYHILFLLGLLEWTPIAQEFIILDGARVAVFQTVIGPIAMCLGIPLTFHSQLMLRTVSEFIEAALMYKVYLLHGPLSASIWMHLLTRTLLSLSTGLMIDTIRRQAFLKSISRSKSILPSESPPNYANVQPVKPQLGKSYAASLPPSKLITLKSSPHRIEVMEESIPSYNHTALARRIKAHHPETYKLYLRIREGCLVYETAIASTGKSSFDVLDLIEELHPENEQDSFESPMMLRAYVRDASGGMSSCVYVHQNGEWRAMEELDSSSSSSSLSLTDFSLSLDPVLCLPLGERTKRLIGVWDGPPPPSGSLVEAVIRGKPLKVSCFPDPSSWAKGTEIKITLFLDEVHPDDGGIIDLNVWSPPPTQHKTIPSLPQLLMVSSRMLLLPCGSDGAVHELSQMFTEAGGSPSDPWGSLKALAEEMSSILWASSAASTLDPDLVPALQKAAKAIIQWASDCECPSLEKVFVKASKSIKRNRISYMLGLYTSALSGPWKSYPPTAAWISLFAAGLVLGTVKSITFEGISLEFAINSLTAMPYLICILMQILASRQSTGPVARSARRFLEHAGVFLFASRVALALLLLSSKFALAERFAESSMKKFFGDWTSFTLMYVTTKTCYSLFERFDLRGFVPLVLGIDAPIAVFMMRTLINCSLASSVAFGILANIYCVIVRVLFDQCCARQAKNKAKNVKAS